MARSSKCRNICSMPKVCRFSPAGSHSGEAVVIGVDAYEVIRLLDHRLLSQEECAVRMHISRTTVTRIYQEARRKIAEALVEGKEIVIAGGEVMICTQPRPECRDEPNCCHKRKENKEESA